MHNSFSEQFGCKKIMGTGIPLLFSGKNEGKYCSPGQEKVRELGKFVIGQSNLERL